MDKADIAATLTRIATILDLLGENQFKARAHQNAARIVETLTEDIALLVEENRLVSIKGIGKQIAAKIEALIKTGVLPELIELEAKVPEGIFEILKIHGLGPKKVKVLWSKLDIKTIGELEYACNENRLVELDGFGPKSQEKILRGIETLKKYADRRLLPEAMAAAQEVLVHLLKESSVIRAQITGSARRGKETVKDIDIIASSRDAVRMMNHFINTNGVIETVGKGETKSTVRLQSGMLVDLRVVSDDQYPHALQHFTGSKEHNTALRKIAKDQGYKMNEYGLFNDEQVIICGDEEAVYNAIGLEFVPPERRENIGEIEQAQAGEQPKLVTMDDLQGLIHCHTQYSDGRETVEKMAKECMKRGYQYLGVSDHSKTAFYAGGMSIDELRAQGEEIDELNEELEGFHIFKGVESDILTDGSLDYPDEVLDELDFVIASVHAGWVNDTDKMTERIVAAVENPYTTILGHPTGRLLLAREAYPLDMELVIEACAKHGVVIELNSNPHRLDLDWREMGAVRAAGVDISINPDAHRIPGIDHIPFGVMIARKGGYGPGNILNAMDVNQVKEHFKKQRK